MIINRRFFLYLLILSVLLTPHVFSQEAEPEDHTPAEYEEDEFPVWLQDLRRAEIITVGSFPFTFFISQISFGFYRYAVNDFAVEYSPGFFMGSGSANPYSNDEKTSIILISIGLSAAMALTDYIIGKFEQ